MDSGSVVSLWDHLLHWFDRQGPIANAFTILIPLGTAAWTGHWSIRKHIHRRLRDTEGEIHDLKADLAHREESLAALRSKLKLAEQASESLGARLAETALANAEKERREGNVHKANRMLVEWLESEGESISKLLFQRAEWASAYAVGDLRAIGLTAAETYSTAALALWPVNNPALDLLADVQATRLEEAQAPLPTVVALMEFDRHVFEAFDADLVHQAIAATEEADRQYLRGRYHIALPIIERAILLWLREVGRTAGQTLRAQRRRAYILDRLGRSEEALPLAQTVATVFEENPALGPSHPDTLGSRYLVAQILNTLGRSTEALPLAQAVARAYEESPVLGPSHPDTLVSLSLVAQVLDALGQSAEALPLAQALAKAYEENPALDPSHADTLNSRHLVAHTLDRLGRSEEALPLAQTVAKASEENPALGPSHPDTLNSRLLVARILHNLGRSEEALPLAQAVAKAYEESPALGPSHPYTLGSRYLVAQILDAIERSEEVMLPQTPIA